MTPREYWLGWACAAVILSPFLYFGLKSAIKAAFSELLDDEIDGKL